MPTIKYIARGADIKMNSFKKIIFIFSFGLLLAGNHILGFAEEGEGSLPPLPEGPLLLTSIKPDQLSADYWINRLDHPDQILKTPEELAFFNQEILSMAPDRVNIFKTENLPRASEIRSVIAQEYSTVSNRKFFDVGGAVVPKSFFETKIKPIVRSDEVPDRIKFRWGAAVRPTSVRALPTTVEMLEEIGDVEFDQLQYTLIKLMTPVVIYHTSADGKWYYVQAPYVRGWVASKDIALFETQSALKNAVRSDSFLAVTGESISVFSDPERGALWLKPTMGTVLPLIRKDEANFVVSRPIRAETGAVILKEGFVSRSSDVSVGFLPYTQRNVIRQAFKLLGARYGWGGMYNGRDCSGFTHDVFLSLGLDLPRDSKNQAQIGTQLGHFEAFQSTEDKINALRNATPGITLIRKPLHMMLYLGEVDGQFYIIHSTWAERISKTSDEKNRINQVVVSDMTLNGKSYLGSLFDRAESMNELL